MNPLWKNSQFCQLLPLKTPDRIASAQFQEGSNFNYEGTRQASEALRTSRHIWPIARLARADTRVPHTWATPASKQAARRANKQASTQASGQASKQANRQGTCHKTSVCEQGQHGQPICTPASTTCRLHSPLLPLPQHEIVSQISGQSPCRETNCL